MRAIAIKLYKYRKKKIKITSDQWNYTGISLVGAFANSGSFGRGIVISPDAKIDDGILNISHIGTIGMLEYVKFIIPLKKGKKINIPEVVYTACKTATVTSNENVLVECDGEVVGELTAKFSIIENCLSIILPN